MWSFIVFACVGKSLDFLSFSTQEDKNIVAIGNVLHAYVACCSRRVAVFIFATCFAEFRTRCTLVHIS